MFFLNLSLPEFLAIAGALSGLITVLYFFDRSKRRKTVSTLRFWTDAIGAQQQKRRKSVRQPWSLLLQLISILLLLLAIARLEWGSRQFEIRNNVLLLDTSAAASWKSGDRTVLDREKSLGIEYLSHVSERDRIMLVRVDALSSPATPFVADRQRLRKEINRSRAGYSALNIQRALNYARSAQREALGSSGEVIYLGPGRVSEPFSGAEPGVRVLRVAAGRENCGIRGISVTRTEGDDVWKAVVTIRNDGVQIHPLQITAHFEATPFAPRRMTLKPHEETAISYQFVANSPGRLDFRLQPEDGLASDNGASVTLPSSAPPKVIIYSARPDAWRPLLSPDKSLSVRYESIEHYAPRPEADVVILDRFAPRLRPKVPSLWVDVPAEGSPLPIKSAVIAQSVRQWNSDSELGVGLHARDLRLPKAKVFQIFDRDFVVASTAQGPVAVVRPGSGEGEKLAIVGFDFLSGPLRYRVSSPILFANMMRWLVPQAFRTIQVTAEPVGLASVPLDTGEEANDLRVTDDVGRAVPFLLQNHTLQFFVDTPSVVQVTTARRERFLSLILPRIATDDWKLTPGVSQSMPPFSPGSAAVVDVWPLLACLGGSGLILEWFMFGGSRSARFRSGLARSEPRSVAAGERTGEFVTK